MSLPKEEEVMDLMDRYKQKLSNKLGVAPEKVTKPIFSREYQEFKLEYLPKRFSWYEKACNLSEKILKIRPPTKTEAALVESIKISHLNVTPTGTFSFSIFGPLIFIFVSILLSFAIFQSLFFILFFLMVGMILIIPLQMAPHFFANNWRMKASNQMVLCIFYVVTFMRHTSNIELAIDFASEHLAPPLSLDLKKVVWDVETEKFESVKESLDQYLETWRKWNMEFIEAFHLIESSLYEPSEERRLTLLDKSLDVILTETYEKMLHYSHNLKSPITMIHMLGIILPILGLVILPLVVAFMQEIEWYHLAAGYNLLLPVGVYFLGKNVLSKRPTGYGDTDVSDINPELKKYKNIIIRLGSTEIKINPLIIAVTVSIVFLIIGFTPLLMHTFGIADIPLSSEIDDNSPCGYKFCLLEYRIAGATEGPRAGRELGPYGLGSSILSLFVTLGVGLPIALYYKFRSKNVIKIRNRSKKLEDEFASALFQLGSRLGDGIPAEIAFGKVSYVMQGTISGKFFELVNTNIKRLGMSVKEAIFNPRTGAILSFPSNIIESSMKVLVQSAKKGPKVAAIALMNISRYVKEIHKVNERLKDLMADVISSMKSQINFMAPVIGGIVIGITSMITTILGSLTTKLGAVAQQELGGGAGGAPSMDLLGIMGDGIPTYYFQIIVGIYLVQIVYVLSILSNGIENGADKLAENYNLGNNMFKSIMLYSFVSLTIMILFNIIASSVIGVTVG